MTSPGLPELRAALVDAARRRQHEAVAVRRRRLQWPRWRAPLAVLLAVLAGTGAAFASGLISFGAPAPSQPVFAQAGTGLGKVTPGSVQTVPMSVADPHGGPPWGMRVTGTSRGAGCLQVGRVVDAKLVALGQDGAFDNDGRAHVLPLSTNVDRLNCTLVDAQGRVFDSVTLKSQAASAAQGVHCRAPGDYAPSHHKTPPTCPLADERNLYYGMLGPDATGITYSDHGQPRTVATVGPDGAYLIVTTGTRHQFTGGGGRRDRAELADADAVPAFSPITAIHYRNGDTCQLVTAHRWVYGSHACDPALPEPYGYAHPPIPTHAQLATPIHTKVSRNGGDWKVTITFRAPVAISTLRGDYALGWHPPGGAAAGEGFGAIDLSPRSGSGGNIPNRRDVSAGQTLSAVIDSRFLRGVKVGTIHGTVVLNYAAGPLMSAAEDTVRLTVGSFVVKVP